MGWRWAAGVCGAALAGALGCQEAPDAEPQAPAWLGDPTQTIVTAAGDVATCGAPGTTATAKLLDGIVGTVLGLGDLAYPSGSEENFRECYAPTWGRHRPRTRPVPGNHDYDTPGASAYFAYFGEAAGEPGKGYYSFALGPWHAVALNSEIDLSATSAQLAWLRQDLAVHPTRCLLAFWHRPRFSSGREHGGDATLGPVWDLLYEAGAELVLNGHEHGYERFAKQAPSGAPNSASGIRQFVVGTGGSPNLYAFASPVRNSEVRRDDTHGVLALRLTAERYEWWFAAVPGSAFGDSGSAACHDPPPAATIARRP